MEAGILEVIHSDPLGAPAPSRVVCSSGHSFPREVMRADPEPDVEVEPVCRRTVGADTGVEVHLPAALPLGSASSQSSSVPASPCRRAVASVECQGAATRLSVTSTQQAANDIDVIHGVSLPCFCCDL